MALLDELLRLPASERRVRLQHGDIREALAALGTESGIAWLEKHLESPIGPEWGRLLYSLRPEWKHLDNWIRLDKFHCLAAIDAILLFTPSPNYDDDKEPELPHGANEKLIIDAVNYALKHYDNPRLKDAAKRIRHAWPAGKPKQHVVSVPRAFADAANALFGNDNELMHKWIKSLATAIDPPKSVNDLWRSLLNFGDRVDVLAIIDWREASENIVARLRTLRSAEALPLDWDILASHVGENVGMFHKVNATAESCGCTLISLDTGGDSYALTFLATDKLSECEGLLEAALNQTSVITTFPQ